MVSKDQEKTKAQMAEELDELRRQLDEASKIAHESERALETTRIAQDSLVDTIFVFEAESGKAIYWNRAFREITGYSDQEIAAMKAPDAWYDAEDLERAAATIVDVFQKGIGKVELALITKSGEKIPTEYTGATVPGGEGVPPRIIAVGRDLSARRKADAALRESELRYRTFVENFHGIAFRGNMDFTMSFFHGAVEEITGYTEQELASGNPRWDQIIYHEDQDHVAESLANIGETPKFSAEREYRVVRKDGTLRWVHERIQNVCDDSGKPCLVQGAIYDVTERKRAEEALKESEEEYRQLVEQSPLDIQVYRPDGVMAHANKAWEQMWKAVARDAVGTYNVLEDQQLKGLGIFPQVEKAFAGEPQLLPDTEYVPEKSGHVGRPRWLRSRIYPILDLEGAVKNVVLIHEDVTDRKLAEEEASHERDLMRILLDSVPDHIYFKDKNRRFVRASNSFCDLFGLSMEELIGKTDEELFPDEIAEIYAESDKYLNDGKVEKVFDILGVRGD